jgi:hypothetical protein
MAFRIDISLSSRCAFSPNGFLTVADSLAH